MQRFLRLAGFLRAAASTAEERQRTSSGVFASLPLTTSCVFCLRMRGGGDNYRSNNNYSGNNNMSFGNGHDQCCKNCESLAGRSTT
nr:hypothetical protein [Tanacetum cinerariifolium]